MNRQSGNTSSSDRLATRRVGRRVLIATIASAIIALGVLVALFANLYQARRDAKADIRVALTDSAQTRASALHTRIDAQYSILEAAAAVISAQEPFALSDGVPWLADVRKASDFSFLAVIDDTGLCHYEDGSTQSVADRAYFIESMAGGRSIEKIDQTRSDGKGRFILSVPIVKNERPVGVLACSYDEDRFASLLVSESYSQQGYAFVCDGNGHTLILGSQPGGAVSEAVLSALSVSLPAETGLLVPRVAEGHTYYAVYEPLGISDWQLIHAVPDRIINNLVEKRTAQSMTSVGIAMVATLLAFSTLLIQERRNRRRVHAEHEQLRVREEEYRIATEQGNQFVYRFDLPSKTAYFSPSAAQEIGSFQTLRDMPDAFLDGEFVAPESKDTVASFFHSLMNGAEKAEGDFRMKNRKGRYCWYHNEATMIYSDSGKPLRAIISFRDVTRQREMAAAYESWRQSVNAMPPERYALFTYNLTKDRRTGFEGALLTDDPDAMGMSFDERTARFSARVFPEDRDAIIHLLTRRNVLNRYRQGLRFTETEFRYAEPGMPPRWFALTLRLVEEDGSGDLMAFLLYENIDARKREELELKEKSEKDPLTGVLNRTALIEHITEALTAAPDQHHAVMMIDLDDFKRINDTGGHAEGDLALITIAKSLKATLRAGDCIGRIGGDEFILFMRNIPSEDAILKRAPLMLETLSYSSEKGIAVSGSLGIALYPQHGRRFSELYAAADAAMYHAKQLGKHNFVLYNPLLAMAPDAGVRTRLDPAAGASERKVDADAPRKDDRE